MKEVEVSVKTALESDLILFADNREDAIKKSIDGIIFFAYLQRDGDVIKEYLYYSPEFIYRAPEEGEGEWRFTYNNVTHAYHSPLMALEEIIRCLEFELNRTR